MALTDGLVGLWHQNNDWLDSSGSGNNGTATGAIFDGTNKKLGSHAGDLDGIDDYVSCGNGSSLNFDDAAQFSFSCWIRITGNGSDGAGGTVLGRYSGGLGYLFYHYRDSRGLYFQCNSNGFNSNYQLSDNTWYHVVYVRDDVNHTFYANNAQVAQEAKDTLSQATSEFYIATYSAGNPQVFKGQIDELAAWNRAITVAEIAEIYNGGTGIEIGVAAADTETEGVVFRRGTGRQRITRQNQNLMAFIDRFMGKVGG